MDEFDMTLERKYQEGRKSIAEMCRKNGIENMVPLMERYKEMFDNPDLDRMLLGGCALLGLMTGMRDAFPPREVDPEMKP